MDISITSTNVLNWIENKHQSSHIGIPPFLLKFYSPKSYNFASVERGEIFLASPASFNDPYDCKLTFNREDILKRYLSDWIYQNCKNLEYDEIKTDSFDWNDSHTLWRTKDPSPICHRDDYRTTIEEALLGLLCKKEYDFRQIVNKRIKNLLTDAHSFIDDLAKTTNIGVSCFCNCENPYNIDQTNLMWSHYAQNHKGFCVMYCFNETITGKPLLSDVFKTLIPVKYTKHRIFIPKMIILRYLKKRLTSVDKQNILDRIGHSLITKSTVWKYENEWRLISQKVKETIPFPYAAAIFIGCNADKGDRKRLKQIGKSLNIPVIQTELHNTIYKLNNFDPESVYYSLFSL